MDDLLHSLAAKSHFSTLDLSHSYWQIEIGPRDRAKTAFTLPSGLYQFNTLPMGLRNASATCQRVMQAILQSLIPAACQVYQDDVIVYGRTHAELLQNLQAVLEKIRESGLTLNPKKCEFDRQKVRYLGHVVSAEGIETDPEKIRKVQDWPTPVSADEVHSFLGLAAYYRSYVPNFAEIAFPLYRLTETNRVFAWTPECQSAFEKLISALTSAPILAYPNLSP